MSIHRDDAAGRRHCIATVCLSGTIEDKLEAAAHAGFDGVEIFENDLVTSRLAPREIARFAGELGLSIDLYQPFRDAEGLPEDRFGATLRRFERKLDVMAELGTDMILVCSSVAADTVPDDDVSASQLRRLADAAAARGVRIAYEALAWGTHVSRWDHAWDVVRRAAHPALGLCLDSFHIGSLGTPLDRLAEVPADRLFFLQLADAPRLAMDVLQWSRHHRVFPGQGSFGLTDFTTRVLAAGYRGPLSLEVFNDVFRQADPARTAVDARRSLLVLEDSVARSVRQHDGALARLPDAAPVSGFGFVELSVDGVSGPKMADVLTSLGFAHTGQHRSKPVQLWEQGDARIVLNSAVVRVEESPGLAAVNGIAVDSADPTVAARRAEALRATPAHHRRGAGEADLATFLAPDGSEVIFCRAARPSAPASWSVDFLPTGVTGVDAPPLRSIDHVALSQPFDHFEEAGLFYRSTLGLTDDTAGEFAAPFGLVRTHSVADAKRTVRIALSVALLRRGDWMPGVPNPQHVAFATDDLFGALSRLRELGAPLLQIPENYYADLDARVELPPDTLNALQTANALYDHDANGAFLHAYTEIITGQVFFEIVQRVDDYAGYGEVNAPTRMAAHRAARLSRQRQDPL
jgi:4-hydroxyphenylpyruvate dioxygenase